MWPADAAEEFAGSFRLRGGYDTNPLLAPIAAPSAFMLIEGAVAAGRDNGEWITGATGEASFTKYENGETPAVHNYRLRLRLANKGQNDVAIDATTALAQFQNYDTRSISASQRVHVQWLGGAVRPFVLGEVRLASLNEQNVLLGEFLPEPMRYLRGTVSPGVAYMKDKTEFGVSVAVARTMYEDELDLFGFRRDSTRFQPSVYAKQESGPLTVSGTVSYLRARSEDVDFTDVNHILFEFSGTANWESWTFEAGAARTAEDTTFPVSPLTINTVLQGKISYRFDENTSAALVARQLHRKYWDTPLWSLVNLGGIELTREIAPHVSLSAELLYAKSVLISGDESEGVIAMLGIQRRFGGEKKNIRAGQNNPAR